MLRSSFRSSLVVSVLFFCFSVHAAQNNATVTSNAGTTVPAEYFNPQTGESRLVDAGKTAPENWKKVQPPSNPQGLAASSLGRELRRCVNPGTGETQWIGYAKQPPAGWILLKPAYVATARAEAANAAGKMVTTKQPSSDYGAGGSREQDTDQAGAVLQGRVFDEHRTVRQNEKYDYATLNGKSYLSEKRTSYYDADYRLDLKSDYKFNFDGSLKGTDATRYGLRGERTSEETTTYRTDGYEIRDWNIGNRWTKDFHAYKPATPAATTPALPPGPVNLNIGVLCPRSFHPGDTITGSLWPSSYAENFKMVPGFSEFTFPISAYRLADGTVDWARIEIGVKGNGYLPVTARGTFSIHIPQTWRGPLDLQVRPSDALNQSASNFATLHIGDSVEGPQLPEDALPSRIAEKLQYYAANHLVDMWNEAFDLEGDLHDAYAAKDPDWSMIDDMEEYLDDLYDDIDFATTCLPQEVVYQLANGLAQRSRATAVGMAAFADPTPFNKSGIKEMMQWASFLEDEAAYSAFRKEFGRNYKLEPYWTNPVLTQGKLGAVRGFFGDDPYGYRLSIDKAPIYPLASTPTDYYFVPSMSLSPGLHYFNLESPFFPKTTLPVFHMTLSMWADQLNLHKGQTTSYHAKLDGLNGLPGSAWNSPFYPTDLVSPSEWSGVQGSSSGPIRTGYLTLSITNQSVGTIGMQNVFRTLDAKYFAPLGSYQVDGGIGAVKDGTFSILGVARAYLEPELAFGESTPKSNSPKGFETGWLPPISWNSQSQSPTTTNCSASDPYRSDCMNRFKQEAYDKAIGNSPSTANVDNQTELDAARKRYTAALFKYGQFHGFGVGWGLAGELESAFQNGLSHLSQEDKDDYKKARERWLFSMNNRWHYYGEYQKDPSEYNEKMLEAWTNDDREDGEALDRMKDYIIDQFSDEDLANWQSVRDEIDKFNEDRAASESELRDAENELNRAERAANTK